MGRAEAKATNTQARNTSGAGLSQANEAFDMTTRSLGDYGKALGEFTSTNPYSTYADNPAFQEYKATNPFSIVPGAAKDLYTGYASGARDLYSTYGKTNPYASFMDTDLYSSPEHKRANTVLADTISAGGRNSTVDQLNDFAKRTGSTSSQFGANAEEIARQNLRDSTRYKYEQANRDLDKTNENRQFAAKGLDEAQYRAAAGQDAASRYATGGQDEANRFAATGTEGHNLAAARGLDEQAYRATQGTDARQRTALQGAQFSPELWARLYGTGASLASGALGPAAQSGNYQSNVLPALIGAGGEVAKGFLQRGSGGGNG